MSFGFGVYPVYMKYPLNQLPNKPEYTGTMIMMKILLIQVIMMYKLQMWVMISIPVK